MVDPTSISRRQLFRLGAVGGGAALLAACQPSQPAAPPPTAAATAGAPPAAAPAGKPAASPAAVAPPAPSPSASAQASPAAVGAASTVKTVHVPSTLFAPLYVALEKGYFKDEGITLQLDRAAAGQDVVALIANGQLDASVAGFAAATFNALNRGLDFRVVSSMGQQPTQGFPSALMVRSDLLQSGAVKEITDLRGKKIAVSGGPGSAGGYWISTKLRPAGLSFKDVEFVNMGFPDMVIAFKNRSVDAAFPPAPFTTAIKAEGTADFFGGPISPGASAVGTTFGGPFLKNRRDVAQGWINAAVRGSRDIQGEAYSTPQNLQIYSTYTGAAVEALRSQDPYQYDPDLTPDEKTLQDMQEVFRGENLVQLPRPLAPAEYIDATLTRAAAQKLGAFKPRS